MNREYHDLLTNTFPTISMLCTETRILYASLDFKLHFPGLLNLQDSILRNLFLHNHKAKFSDIYTQSRQLVKVSFKLLKFCLDNYFTCCYGNRGFGTTLVCTAFSKILITENVAHRIFNPLEIMILIQLSQPFQLQQPSEFSVTLETNPLNKKIPQFFNQWK